TRTTGDARGTGSIEDLRGTYWSGALRDPDCILSGYIVERGNGTDGNSKDDGSGRDGEGPIGQRHCGRGGSVANCTRAVDRSGVARISPSPARDSGGTAARLRL